MCSGERGSEPLIALMGCDGVKRRALLILDSRVRGNDGGFC